MSVVPTRLTDENDKRYLGTAEDQTTVEAPRVVNTVLELTQKGHLVERFQGDRCGQQAHIPVSCVSQVQVHLKYVRRIIDTTLERCYVKMCVCVCVRACVRACVSACVCVCMCVCV